MAQFTIQQAFELAVQHHQAGRLKEAETFYRLILSHEPQNADAMRLLGMISHQLGQTGIALDLIRRAMLLRPNFAQAQFNLGNILHADGQLDQAAIAFRQAIASAPNYAQAHYNLGCVLKLKGQTADAIAALQQAIALRPGYAEAHNNLGVVLGARGLLEPAVAAYREAVALRPDYADAHSNLGSALREQGQLDEAIDACKVAVTIDPNLPEAHNNLGNALKAKGRLDDALAAFRKAISIRPGYAEAHNNLGSALADRGQLDDAIEAYGNTITLRPSYVDAHANLGVAYQRQGQLDKAIAAYREAIALRPDYADAHSNLGSALKDKGRLDDALAAFRKAISLRPGYAEAHYNLGVALAARGQLGDAIEAYGKAITLRPGYVEAHTNLGVAYQRQGQLDKAIAAYRGALALKPEHAQAHSNLVFVLNCHPGYGGEAIAEEHRRWNRQHAEPLQQLILPHSNDRDPDRRLRIGYISPDFRDHAVAKFLLPLLSNHDKGRVEIFAYAHVPTPDPMTRRLRACADTWRSIVEMTHEQVADLVRHDQIDIFVDLAGHTFNNHLLVLARKPAPIQVTYLGYPNTTGMTTIDYRFSDELSDPPGETESLHTEKLVRLPQCMWCYGPQEDAPPLNLLPALGAGKVTFGTFNQSAKITDEVLRLWAAVLRASPASTLLLKNRALRCPGVCRAILNLLAAEGIAEDRVRLLSHTATEAQHMAIYHEMDIALDTFPYNGTTTTCEALWMGLPVVTLAGRTHVSRVGVSLLNAVALPELVAASQEQYVKIAVELALDLTRLAQMRSTMRQRMRQSPLMDGPRLAGAVETAYRTMWATWCKARQG